MTFGFSGFGKALGMFGGGQSGGHGFGDKVGLFGGKGFDRDFGRDFGKSCDQDDDRGNGHDHGQNTHHDTDHGHGSDSGADCGAGNGGSTGGSGDGSTGGGATAGTGWPTIPANTAGITFHVDYEGDGVTDNAIAIGRSADTKTFEDYLAKARDQVAADNPDVDPKEVIFKATITDRSGAETYYHFTGLEEGNSGEDLDAGDDDDGDDGCGDGHGDHDQDGHDGHGQGSQCHGGRDHGGHDHGGQDDHDEDRACGKDHAGFFESLMGGGKSFDCGQDDDRWSDDEDDHDHHEDHDIFC